MEGSDGNALDGIVFAVRRRPSIDKPSAVPHPSRATEAPQAYAEPELKRQDRDVAGIVEVDPEDQHESEHDRGPNSHHSHGRAQCQPRDSSWLVPGTHFDRSNMDRVQAAWVRCRCLSKRAHSCQF